MCGINSDNPLVDKWVTETHLKHLLSQFNVKYHLFIQEIVEASTDQFCPQTLEIVALAMLARISLENVVQYGQYVFMPFSILHNGVKCVSTQGKFAHDILTLSSLLSMGGQRNSVLVAEVFNNWGIKTAKKHSCGSIACPLNIEVFSDWYQKHQFERSHIDWKQLDLVIDETRFSDIYDDDVLIAQSALQTIADMTSKIISSLQEAVNSLAIV
jgi:hypothetical protein